VSALVLATMLVGGQLVSLAHFAGTPHVECSDDGELIHVAAVAESAPLHATIARDTAVPDPPHRHEHCRMVSMRAPLLSGPAHNPVALRSSMGRLPTRSDISAPPPPIAILRQAPKSSPPARSV
jgi:hypothetical protein